jgi:putative photosynthetic complex assembly protein
MGHAHFEPFPKPLMIGAVALVVTSVILTAAVRYERVRSGEVLTPQEAARSVEALGAVPPGVADADIRGSASVVLARTFIIREHADKTITVAALDGSMSPRTFAENEGGFVRGTLRALRHRRGAVGNAGDPVLQISRLSDGRLIAEETGSGMVLDLAAFGATNRAAFAAVLDGTELPR